MQCWHRVAHVGGSVNEPEKISSTAVVPWLGLAPSDSQAILYLCLSWEESSQATRRGTYVQGRFFAGERTADEVNKDMDGTNKNRTLYTYTIVCVKDLTFPNLNNLSSRKKKGANPLWHCTYCSKPGESKP